MFLLLLYAWDIANKFLVCEILSCLFEHATINIEQILSRITTKAGVIKHNLSCVKGTPVK